jgi:hypothetical protein
MLSAMPIKKEGCHAMCICTAELTYQRGGARRRKDVYQRRTARASGNAAGLSQHALQLCGCLVKTRKGQKAGGSEDTSLGSSLECRAHQVAVDTAEFEVHLAFVL